jgi:hypothetical protein
MDIAEPTKDADSTDYMLFEKRQHGSGSAKVCAT